jgi:hypothetical protein
MCAAEAHGYIKRDGRKRDGYAVYVSVTDAERMEA